MGSVAVSDESSEQRRVEAVGPRRYRLSKQELQVYRRAMAPGDRADVCKRLSDWFKMRVKADQTWIRNRHRRGTHSGTVFQKLLCSVGIYA